MTDRKLTFKRVDSGCTMKDYRARFIDDNNLHGLHVTHLFIVNS